MSGTVLHRRRPRPGALLDVWQADEDGFYDVQYATSTSARARATCTPPDGRFWFWTVQPEAYPIPTDGPVGGCSRAGGRSPMRPAHVHFKVTAPGYQTLITHVFDESDQYLDTDAVSACAARCWRPSSTTSPAPRRTGARWPSRSAARAST